MSEKLLASATEATRYQRAWFRELRGLAAAGTPIALVNADAPQEIFRAMGIPYVVNQWWASVVAAKRRAPHYLELLRERGYPDYTEQYSSISLGSLFDQEPEHAPWGGLPRPSIVLGENVGDGGRKIFDVWGGQPDIAYYALESAAENAVPVNWWDLMPHDWEKAIGTARLDLMESELEGLIRFLETTTGHVLRERELRRVLDLINEQAEWNRRSRDLIASTTPSPLAVTDSIPSVMIPQWHRGTEWARDAARRFYEEVEERVGAGAAVCENERVRLMWIGRGLWYDMDFYRRFEQRHGAVFVWSMYLAIAADGYPRYGDNPLRTLAARFAAFNDQLYTPPWSCEWYVKEAKLHRVDGVVHLVSDDARGSYFTNRALRAAGIPVYELHADNVDTRSYQETTEQALTNWLETEVVR
ncbi:MAG: 2-hydroxyacyl-CoA dehydratase family protein [Actinophytocola sp.]|uniref:2-hydroxyacyl-CoA dehydratase n=1 Tax=Actinophytocola sp. TaxID=1872138 RepID=UPI003C727DEF